MVLRAHEKPDNLSIEKTGRAPEILESKVQHVLKAIKNRKNPNHDNVHAEVLKIFDTKHLTYILNRVYDSGKIRTDWLK